MSPKRCLECHSETKLVKEPENGGFRNVCDMCNWYGSLQGVVVLQGNGKVDIEDLVLTASF